VAYIQAGAGLVADSVPAREYQETVNKQGALLRSLATAHGGAPAGKQKPQRGKKKKRK
jgi:anthranilate synthase component 1